MKNLRTLIYLAYIVYGCSYTLHATNHYVNTNGTLTGAGSATNGPWLTASNALKGTFLSPGDTVWFLPGWYTNVGYVTTSANGSAGNPITYRGYGDPFNMTHLDVYFNPFGTDGYQEFYDLHFYNSNTNRYTVESGYILTSTNIPNFRYQFSGFSPNTKIVNCIFNDGARGGIYLSDAVTNTLVYASMSFNHGWIDIDNSGEHAFYIQPTNAFEMSDNISFNTTGNGYQIYASADSHNLSGLSMFGNVQWGASALSNKRANRDFLMGTDPDAFATTNIFMGQNMFYYSYQPFTASQNSFGRNMTNGNLIFTNNYMPQGMLITNWFGLIVTNNVLGTTTNEYCVQYMKNLSIPGAIWDYNTYTHCASSLGFKTNGTARTFIQWTNATGFDIHSTDTLNGLTNITFIRTNRYTQCRANIICYNWGLSNNISVDISGFMTNGAHYVVKNAADYFTNAVASGVYAGGSISLSMTNLTIQRPNVGGNTNFNAPVPNPEFNVFVIFATNGVASIGAGGTSNAPTGLRKAVGFSN